MQWSFLVWVDLDRYFPVDGDTQPTWATFILFNQACFVLFFVAYRVIGWPWYSIPLWKDAMAVLPQPAQSYRPGKVWFMYVFLAMDVALGALQLYWFATGLWPKLMDFATVDA